MSVPQTTVYPQFFSNALSVPINWATDDIRMALVTSSYTPDFDTDAFWSDVSPNEVASSGSYVASSTNGGVTLTDMDLVVFNGGVPGGGNIFNIANPSDTMGAGVWAPGIQVAVGDICIPITLNGTLFVVTGISGTGTTGGSEPSWPSLQGQGVNDNSGPNAVNWACIGKSITIAVSDDVVATAATITARYGVIYDATPGSGGANPLIACVDFGTNQVSSAGTFTVSLPHYGWFSAAAA